MNALCYKIVFSKRLGTLVAVGEHTVGQGKTASGSGVRSVINSAISSFIGALNTVFAAIALTFLTASYTASVGFAAAPAANALPSGASVNSGSVAISSTSSSNAANMTITQTTDKASVNWQSFNIGSAARVNVQQNSASSVLLNRVVGNDPSQIFGKLSANGQVILINPNGIVFGSGGSVTASAFTASTFGLSEQDFANNKYKFTRSGSAAGVTVKDGAALNVTAPGGYIALIGASVDNQGRISTQQGAVVMAAGESVALPASLTNNISVPLSGKVRLEMLPSTINAMVANSGTITTEGGQVLMQAAALSDAVASITHTGTIDTTGAKGGAVTVLADGGVIKATGSITANSSGNDEHGQLRKGGDIIIGRDEETGVLAHATDVSGATLISNKGFVETSAHFLAVDGAIVKAASWLLDPDNIDITGDTAAATAGYSKIKASDIVANLNMGTSVTIATSSTAGTSLNQPGYKNTPGTGAGTAVSGDGNILVNAAISKTLGGDASLTLLADNGITVNQAITSTSTKLNVTMKANGVATLPADSKGVTLNSNITTNGSITLTGISNAPNGASGVGVNSSGTLSAGGNVLVTGTANGNSTGVNTGAITSTGGSVTVIGTSATAKGATTGVINAAGDVTITGTSGIGTSIGALTGATTGAITSGGNVKVTGKSGSAAGVVVNAITGKDIVIVGNSTTGAVLGGTSVINATAGGVSITGTGNNGSGWAITTNNTITATGDIEINTTSAAKHGITLGGAVKSTGGAVTIYADVQTNGSGSAINGNHAITAKNDIKITGKTNGFISINSLGAITSNDGNVVIEGTSRDSIGVNLTNMVTAKNDTVNLTGTSNSNGFTQGLNINALTAGVEAQSYTVKGFSNSGNGIVMNGTVGNTANAKFISTSTTVESLIEGKTTSGTWGVSVLRGGLTIDAGGGKSVLRSAVGSNGGVTLGDANAGLTVNTKGDVTFGANDHTKSNLVLRGATINADGGKLTFLGKSAGAFNAISFEDASATPLSITGNAGALINFDGQSTGSGAGINMRVGSNTSHTITSNGAGGSIIIKGASSASNGVNVEIAKITANNGNSIAIMGDAVTSGTGSGKGVYIATALKANGGGNIDITGTSKSGGTAVDINAGGGPGAVIADTGKVTITGNTPSTTGTGVGISNTGTISGGTVELTAYTAGTNAAINTTGFITSSSGDIKLEGISTSGPGVAMTSSSATAAISAANNVIVKGTSNSAGVVLVGTTTVTGKNVTIEGTSANGNGVFTNVNIKATSGDISITGKSVGASALSLHGVMTASQNVKIKGENTSSGNLTTAVYINKAVTATAGTIDITAITAGTSSLALQIDPGASLITTNNAINLKADTLSIAGTTINAGTGKVSIKTVSANTKINIGGADAGSATTSARTLGLSNAELNQITAGNLIIGDASNTVGITVSAATTTLAQTGNVTLQTGGNIAVNQVLTIDSSKTLTLNGAGANSTITDGTSGAIKASKLELLGANAAVTLDSKLHEVGTLAADVKSIIFANKKVLTVGAVNTINSANQTTGTVGIKAKEGVRVTTETGNLNINEAINNLTSGNVVMGAGVSEAAGLTVLGDVKTTLGKAITTQSGGKTLVYTGSAAGSGLLSHLNAALGDLKVTGDATQNTDTNFAFNNGAGISGSTETAQVMFREKVTITNGLVGTNVAKTYGDAETKNTATVALLTETKAKLKQEGGNLGTLSGTSANYTTPTPTSGNVIKIAKSVIIDSLTGDLDGAYYSGAQYLKANGIYKYNTTTNPLTSPKYTIDGIVGDVKVTVAQKALTGSIAQGNTTYGDALVAGTVSLTNKVGNDLVDASGVSFTTTGKTSTSGNLKAGTHADVQTVTDLTGADKDNYTFADVKGSYKVDQKALTGSIAQGNTTYGDGLVAGAASLTNKVGTDVVGASGVTITTTGLTSTSGNLKAGTHADAQTVSGLTGADKDNYTFAAVKGGYKVDQRPLSALYAANDKVYDGNNNATVVGSLQNTITGDLVNPTHTGATFDTFAVGTNKTVTVTGISLSGVDLANYKIDLVANPTFTATARAAITPSAPPPPAPVVPTNATSGRVKIPLSAANPFQLASAEELGGEDFCENTSIDPLNGDSTGNSNSSCTCEESKLAQDAQICFEKNTQKISAQ